ncbi:MAG: hypothetical protein KC426_01410 [Oceanospirillaceae bacterium]|nr:hypothetical protein [Oceanospirillaceae bacterium]
MEPIYIFTFTGAFAMGAVLSARQVGHDVLTQNQQALETTDATNEQAISTVPGAFLAAGNIAAIVLIASLVYGGQNLIWWIPVSFLIVSFPAVYHILLRRMLQPKVGSVVYTGLALVGLVPMIQAWMA